MSKLEELAIKLYDHLWHSIGMTDEGAIQIGGDDVEITELIGLLNQIQQELKLKGYANAIGSVYMYQE
jgi:hypothetical protein